MNHALHVTPGPAGLIDLETHDDPLSFLGQLAQQYGDVVRYQTRFGPCFFFVHPEHVQTALQHENFRRAPLLRMMLGDGLLASNGPRWKSQRRLVQRDFLPKSVAPFVSVMTREAARTADAWHRASIAGDAVDVSTDMTRLTLRIVIETLFSDQLSDAQSSELCASITQTINDLGKLAWTIFGAATRFTPDSNAKFAASKRVIDAVAYDMIARRRSVSPPERPHDLLTLLIEAETDEGPMSDCQVRDEIVTMLVGGHETTAVALAWAWKAIAENRQVEITLHKELDEVLGGRAPEYEDLQKLSWTRAVFQEALRLYPPVWHLVRVADEQEVIGGHLIPRGACILVSAWFTHRHKDFWPDPERFDPARFISPGAQSSHREAYFPFGGGRHLCLGMHFALLEGTLILAQLARRLRVRPIDGQRIRPNPGLTLRQSPAMSATVQPRHAVGDHKPTVGRPAGREAPTLLDLVRCRAATDADSVAYTFLADGAADARSVTWSQLDRRASSLGNLLRQQGAAGQAVLLALPSGLAFIEWLFACWYADAIPVPVSLPRHRRVKQRLESIIADAGARFVIGAASTQQQLLAERADLSVSAGLKWIDADAAHGSIATSATAPPPLERIALLQYTSGSTGTPRGVIVTHANLMCNSAAVAEAFAIRPGQTIASWLPLFHDMGLVGIVLQAAFSGAHCVFMSPERFLMRPWLWLQMISDYRAHASAAPNFAYDLCIEKISEQHKAKLDLSCWRIAVNGAEPVRAKTLDRFAAAFSCCGFARDAFHPCYGLAETTLFATGRRAEPVLSRRPADGTTGAETGTDGHVGCGRPFADTQLSIVDPQSAVRVPPGTVGEIWLTGNSIADGYWNNPPATAATFNARLQSSTEIADIGCKWLRTGDLGFLGEDGTLFITGRLRELIIIAGRNHFPIDIERTVESADPVIALSGAVAFSVAVDGVERLIVAAEVRREYARAPVGKIPHELDPEAVCRRIRAAVVSANEVTPHEVLLLRPDAIPRTSSGKISRVTARVDYLNRTLERFDGSPYPRSAA